MKHIKYADFMKELKNTSSGLENIGELYSGYKNLIPVYENVQEYYDFHKYENFAETEIDKLIEEKMNGASIQEEIEQAGDMTSRELHESRLRANFERQVKIDIENTNSSIKDNLKNTDAIKETESYYIGCRKRIDYSQCEVLATTPEVANAILAEKYSKLNINAALYTKAAERGLSAEY